MYLDKNEKEVPETLTCDPKRSEKKNRFSHKSR